mmetsp:Transcript_9726/g.24103  ORF Transcript_9726/g.24103 Transcript_9726/m.24103 type:complete len:218 (-) Transcript_9726:892-1545(-)
METRMPLHSRPLSRTASVVPLAMRCQGPRSSNLCERRAKETCMSHSRWRYTNSSRARWRRACTKTSCALFSVPTRTLSSRCTRSSRRHSSSFNSSSWKKRAKSCFSSMSTSRTGSMLAPCPRPLTGPMRGSCLRATTAFGWSSCTARVEESWSCHSYLRKRWRRTMVRRTKRMRMRMRKRRSKLETGRLTWIPLSRLHVAGALRKAAIPCCFARWAR